LSCPSRFTARLSLLACLLAFLTGCANRPPNPASDNVLFFVPGVAGDGRAYDGLIRGLRGGGVDDHLEVVHWGAPGPLFVLNFQNDDIHRGAEKKLAEAMKAWHDRHPAGRIDVIAHSAGCGVTLGALALAQAPAPGTVVLLNPSVSPTYNLRPALAKVLGALHVFHSDQDNFFLSWRTSTFGTYDNVKTQAAGHTGFDTTHLPPPLREKIIQHPRNANWPAQQNDGSHFGTTAKTFAQKTLAPLFSANTPPPHTNHPLTTSN
jgi:hypothetical protein